MAWYIGRAQQPSLSGVAQACMAHHALAEVVGQHPSHLSDDCGLTNARPPQEEH